MPQLRRTAITASYQILGTTTPREWMADTFETAKRKGLIDDAKVLDVQPIGGNDFFNVVFAVDVTLPSLVSLTIGCTPRLAKAITDAIVNDSDTVIIDLVDITQHD